MGAQSQPSAQLSIENIHAPELPRPSPEVQQYTELEENFYRVHTAGIEQDIRERKKYAHRIFCLICSWIGAVFLLLVAEGFGSTFHFALPSSVILAVIGSTTINVLGIFYIVTHYLFPKR